MPQPQHGPLASPGSGESAPTGRRVMVTGGAGFIGTHLVRELLARGDSVTIVDNLSTGRLSNIPSEAGRDRSAGPGVEFIESDLRAALPALAERQPFDEIYHLAAAVGVDLVLRDPVSAIEANVEQTAALLRFARPRAGRGERGPSASGTPVLVASSSEVYGKPEREVFSEDDDVHYGPTTVTRWSYAQTKAIDEYLALAHHEHHGVPCVVVRLFNTVGPGQVGEYGMVLPRFVASALRGEPLTVHGDGSQSRCFCDVRDVARALPVLLGSPHCRGRVFNLGSDVPISIRELAEMVVSLVGGPSQIRDIPYDDAYPRGFEDLRRRRPDLSRVRGAIGFEPRYPLERTIADIASWMRSGGGQRPPAGRA